MFSRYLGQTLGTALFAAVFNSVLLYSFDRAPDDLTTTLPPTNQVIEAIQSGDTPVQTLDFLRQTFHTGIHFVYIGLLVAAVLTLILLLWTPSKFRHIDEL